MCARSNEEKCVGRPYEESVLPPVKTRSRPRPDQTQTRPRPRESNGLTALSETQHVPRGTVADTKGKTKPTVLEGTTSIMIGRIFVMWLCPRIETHDGSRNPCVMAGHGETAWLPWQYVDV